MKVNPWDLEEKSIYWRDWGLAAERAEIIIQNEIAKKK